MRKRLWDLAKSRIEIATILPGHRHKVSLLSHACSTEGSCGSPSSRDRRRQHLLGRARRRGAAPRRIVRRLDRRRAHPRLLRASHPVFTSRATAKVSARPPPPRSCRWAAPRWREEARRAIGDVLASSWAPKRSHRPVAPPSAPPRAATVRPTVLAYTG